MFEVFRNRCHPQAAHSCMFAHMRRLPNPVQHDRRVPGAYVYWLRAFVHRRRNNDLGMGRFCALIWHVAQHCVLRSRTAHIPRTARAAISSSCVEHALFVLFVPGLLSHCLRLECEIISVPCPGMRASAARSWAPLVTRRRCTCEVRLQRVALL